MHSYERNGITIEQCTECRGVFLDRGELEHLLAAETRWNASTTQAGPPMPQAGYSPKPAYGYHKRRKSFLEELFD